MDSTPVPRWRMGCGCSVVLTITAASSATALRPVCSIWLLLPPPPRYPHPLRRWPCGSVAGGGRWCWCLSRGGPSGCPSDRVTVCVCQRCCGGRCHSDGRGRVAAPVGAGVGVCAPVVVGYCCPVGMAVLYSMLCYTSILFIAVYRHLQPFI